MDQENYQLALDTDTIWNIVVNFKNTLLYYKKRLQEEPDNQKYKDLREKRKRTAQKFLTALVEADYPWKVDEEFEYLQSLLNE